MERRDEHLNRWDAALATSLFLLAFSVYSLAEQDAYWSDGRTMLFWATEGIWRGPKVLYFPAYHLLGWLVRPITAEPREVLLLLSSLPTAGCVALVFLACRTSGTRRSTALGASALFGANPSVVFFATCIEYHALHMFGAGVLAWWGAAALRGRRGGGSLLLPAMALLFLQTTHILGVLLLPAAVVTLFFAARSFGWWIAGSLVLAASNALGLWIMKVVDPTVFNMTPHIEASLAILPTWSLATAYDQYFRFAPFVLVITAVAVSVAALKRELSLRTTAVLLAALAPFLGYLPAFPVDELGAYYVGSLPPIAVLAAHLIDRTWKPAIAAGVLALGAIGGAFVAAHHMRIWLTQPAGFEWVDVLNERYPDGGLLLTARASDDQWVRRHTLFWLTIVDRETVWPLSESEALFARNVLLGGAAVLVDTRAADGTPRELPASDAELSAVDCVLERIPGSHIPCARIVLEER